MTTADRLCTRALRSGLISGEARTRTLAIRDGDLDTTLFDVLKLLSAKPLEIQGIEVAIPERAYHAVAIHLGPGYKGLIHV